MASEQILDYGSASTRNFVKERCSTLGHGENLISTHNTVNLVVRFNDKVAVKFGIGVLYAEACALRFAHANLDPALVKVPKLLDFFTDDTEESWPVGYLVMEHAEGVPLDEADSYDSASLVARLIQIIDHMHTFTNIRPGPLDGGHAHGLLWSEYSSGQDFKTKEDLQVYLRTRLDRVAGPGTIDVTQSQLCFCHLDISPRNILLDTDGSVTLLDWGCAGFFPSSFETWSIQLEAHVRANPVWQLLASTIASHSRGDDQSEISALFRVFRANESFTL